MPPAITQTEVKEAVARFGIKEAGLKDTAANWLREGLQMAIGSPRKGFQQLRAGTAFKPEGLLNPKNLFWPDLPQAGRHALDAARGWRLTKDIGGHAAGTVVNSNVLKSLGTQGIKHVDAAPRAVHHIGPWMQRGFQTILPAYGVLQTLRGQAGDPNEGRLSNVLGAMGSAAGSAVGWPLGGMLGTPYIAAAGQRLGQGVGRLLGSRPTPPPPPEPMPDFPAYPFAGALAGGLG